MPDERTPLGTRFPRTFYFARVAIALLALGVITTFGRGVRALRTDLPFFAAPLVRLWWAVGLGMLACVSIGFALDLAERPSRRAWSFATLAAVLTLLGGSLALPGSPTLRALGIPRTMSFLVGVSIAIGLVWYAGIRGMQAFDQRDKGPVS
jgi:hypothetical protein